MGNLPTRLTSFVGRDQEVAELLALSASGRLLTLTGPGGTGKTRLSLEIGARSAERYPDGVYFVPLEPITRGGPGAGHHRRAPEPAGPRRSIARSTGSGSTCATGGCSSSWTTSSRSSRRRPLVTELLADAPGLGILATSREALRVYGEQEYPVPPLAVPDPEAVRDVGLASQFGAVALFLERARAVMPSFGLDDDNLAAVVEICYRLDGLPLAIELAAARVKLLSPAAMLGRLEHRLSLLGSGSRDLPARQQTLRGAIGWSYDLLDAADRDLFGCFSVFAGAVDLESVEAVCAAPGRGCPRRPLVAGGQEPRPAPRRQPMARRATGCWRRSASTPPSDSTEAGRTAELRGRHALHFRGRAEAVGGRGRRRRAGGRWTASQEDHPDLRAAITWSVETGDAPTALAIDRRPVALLADARLHRRGPASAWMRRSPCRAATTSCCGSRRWTRPAGWPTGATTSSAPAGTTRRRWPSSGTRDDQAGIAEALYNLSFTYLFRDDNESGRAARPRSHRAVRGGRRQGRPGAGALGPRQHRICQGSGAARRRRTTSRLLALASFQEVDDQFIPAGPRSRWLSPSS